MVESSINPFSQEVFMNICVFSASSNNVPIIYKIAAEELGQHIASRGHTLVFGGGEVGLMRETARSALQSGGKVIGVIPESLRAKEQRFDHADELIITKTIAERKQIMIDRSDAFVVLPGGFGTLEEMFEVLAAIFREGFSKPLAFLNTAGFFNQLFGFFDFISYERFAPTKWKEAIMSSEKVCDIIEYVEIKQQQ